MLPVSRLCYKRLYAMVVLSVVLYFIVTMQMPFIPLMSVLLAGCNSHT